MRAQSEKLLFKGVNTFIGHMLEFIEAILERFASDHSQNEASTQKGNTSIITKYALTITNILLENIAAIFKMTSTTKMATKIARWGRLTLITLVTHLRDCLLHDI